MVDLTDNSHKSSAKQFFVLITLFINYQAAFSYFDRMEILDDQSTRIKNSWIKPLVVVWMSILVVYSLLWLFRIFMIYKSVTDSLGTVGPDVSYFVYELQLGACYNGLLLVLEIAAIVGLVGLTRNSWIIAAGVAAEWLYSCGATLYEFYTVFYTGMEQDFVEAESVSPWLLLRIPELYIFAGSLVTVIFLLTTSGRRMFDTKWHSYLIAAILALLLIIAATRFL